MKTLGIVGGLSPESTAHYYTRIVAYHRERTGNEHYPRILIASVNFGQVGEWQHAGAWDKIGATLGHEFAALQRAGADFALIAANTPHKSLPLVDPPPGLPVYSILDAAAEGLKRRGIRTVGLTGTRFTMHDGFYAAGLAERGIAAVIPEPREQGEIHRVIYQELVKGAASPAAKARFAEIAGALLGRGAEAILLACTELGMLVDPAAPAFPFVDTLVEHAEGAWRLAAGES